MRTGVLWFFLLLAAATSGRWWTAALWSLAAAVSAFSVVAAWQLEFVVDRSDGSTDGPAEGERSVASGDRWIAAFLAALVPLAAGYGTGLAGVTLMLVAAGCAVAQLLGSRRGHALGALTIGVLISAIAATSVVLAVRIDLWAGLFLILAVSLYDAGCYLMGAEAAGRWEGPAAGLIGALAVTFTLATIDPPPFDRGTAWLTGALVAVSCVVGQWLASACLPRTTARARGLRRLDAYVVAGPVFVLCAELLGS